MSTLKLRQRLVQELLEADSTESLNQKLEALLSPNEFDSIATRLEITRLLKEGVPQRQIVKQLGVGIATVTRGSRELKAGKF